MINGWSTVAEIGAARRDFEAAIPGYEAPVAHAILRPDGGFARVNVGDGLLPAVILATVTGHTRGNASCPLPPDALDRAIALLEPAEACTDVPHPNLAVWRELRGVAGLTAVFVSSLSESTDPSVNALISQVNGPGAAA